MEFNSSQKLAGSALVVLILLLILLLLSFPEQPKPPVPQTEKILEYFQELKDSSESQASYAQNHFSARRIAEGERLYGTALAAHNAAIARITIHLINNTPIDAKELTTLLTDARNAHSAFQHWYAKLPPPTTNGNGAGFASSVGDESIAAVINWSAQVDKRNEDRRRRVAEELKACKMQSWTRLNVN